MSLHRNDRPLDELLGHMAKWKPEHAGALAAAVAAVQAIFADPERMPWVLVTTGWSTDPVIAEVEQVSELVADAVPAIRDRLDDILRLLRDRLHEPATTGAAN